MATRKTHPIRPSGRESMRVFAKKGSGYSWFKRQPIGLKAAFLVIVLPAIITFVSISIMIRHEDSQLETSFNHDGKILFEQIQTMRHWNAGYGGVYVLKKPGMKTNPYLYKAREYEGAPLEIEPEIIDTKGRTFTLKNPALMTRELSELAAKETHIKFHITSLQLLNPDNKADAFEEEALEQFEQGVKEASKIVTEKGSSYFRYMAPLEVQESCLKCHGFQGYKAGDIRGGISVTFDIGQELQEHEQNQMRILFGGMFIYLLMAGILVFSLRRLVTTPLHHLTEYAKQMGDYQAGEIPLSVEREDEIGSLSEALQSANREISRQQAALEEKAADLDQKRRTDAVTNIYNRQHFALEMPRLIHKVHREGLELSLLMIDIDHFKRVNDKYGHQIGDQALRYVSHRLQDHCRIDDILIRFGGEEFVIVLTGSSLAQASEIAERIRASIENSPLRLRNGSEISFTVSIGVASTGKRHSSIESLLLCSDKALYKAKARGRNRVVIDCD